jgi:murein L,D-transpeptidase YcbB/YkuD
MIRSVFILFPVLLLFSCKQEKSSETTASVVDSVIVQDEIILLNNIEVDSITSRTTSSKDILAEVDSFYSRRNYSAAWVNGSGLNVQAFSFLDMLANSISEGVFIDGLSDNAIILLVDTLKSAPKHSFSKEQLKALEIVLTVQYFNYAESKFRGISEEKRRALEWYIPSDRKSINDWLDSLWLQPVSNLLSDEPLHPLYNRLKIVLKKYVKLSQTQSWDSIYLDAIVTDKVWKQQAIVDRLFYLGDLEGRSNIDSLNFANAVMRFQRRHGMKVTAVLDQNTVDNLNIPLRDRIRQLLINMERCRWLPAQPKSDFLVANIPAYTLYAYHADSVSWSSRIIVGKSASTTQVFAGSINEVVLNPYWVVPKSIAHDEIIPAIQQDPLYLTRNHMEVVTKSKKPQQVDPKSINWKTVSPANFKYEIRQLPGSWNALGNVKFMLPNSYSIYLHDTPAKYLFDEQQRTFSHGCIRVEKSMELLDFVVNENTSWAEAGIQRARKSENETHIPLKEKVPVFVVYFTAWVDASGQVSFREDVYGHDQRLSALLFKD